MSENCPKNMEEALKLIEKLQTEITQLHNDNNNLREMLIKSRKTLILCGFCGIINIQKIIEGRCFLCRKILLKTWKKL